MRILKVFILLVCVMILSSCYTWQDVVYDINEGAGYDEIVDSLGVPDGYQRYENGVTRLEYHDMFSDMGPQQSYYIDFNDDGEVVGYGTIAGTESKTKAVPVTTFRSLY